jgi:hypothetical protein
MTFYSDEEVQIAYNEKVDLHAVIKVRARVEEQGRFDLQGDRDLCG